MSDCFSGRRRSGGPSAPFQDVSELSPLEVGNASDAFSTHHRLGRSADYSTFGRYRRSGRSSKEESSLISDLLSYLLAFFGLPTGVLDSCRRVHHAERRRMRISYKLLGATALFMTLFTLVIRIVVQERRNNEPEWSWDHNVYNPHGRQGSSSGSSKSSFQWQSSRHDGNEKHRNLLFVQVAGSESLQKLAEISSRPNRAYARQWGQDYALFTRRATMITRSCFDKAYVLSTVSERQRRNHTPVASHTQYDAIALFPPDAIITDLDYDLLQLLPEDKLVAIAGYNESSVAPPDSHTEIVFFNLRHPYAFQVAQSWWETVRSGQLTCGAGNDLQMLVRTIQEMSEKLGDDLSSLVLGLDETEVGFVGQTAEFHVIKGTAPSVPTSKAVSLLTNLVESTVTIQTTADSVCYRYYPKCEVL